MEQIPSFSNPDNKACALTHSGRHPLLPGAGKYGDRRWEGVIRPARRHRHQGGLLRLNNRFTTVCLV